MGSRIQVDSGLIAQFCRKHHIRKLAFFGSVLREDFRPDSDVDVLVEFEHNQEPGLMRLARMERELAEMIGRPVDMRTPEDLSHLFRNEVVEGAEVQYAP
jgi:predicted nucleotidyltransferase